MKTRLRYILAAVIITWCRTQAQTTADFANVPNPDDLEVDRFGNVWVNYREGTLPDRWHLAKSHPMVCLPML